ncbi:MAG: cupin domain-containing protein [Phaeodactylibacter sp.]|nr:cupin domain-containing protein [Phaeodactylibacter sp.]MCB9294881.1 cupin domain-containing protein [Lewinellaceae bacterium]
MGSNSFHWTLIISCSTFVVLFLILFMPFGVNEPKKEFNLILIVQLSLFGWIIFFTLDGTIFPGQHANEHPKSQTNEFPSLFIIVKGKVTAKLDGAEQVIPSGNAIFIPPGMKHEFINQTEEPVEFVLLMFGEGA